MNKDDDPDRREARRKLAVRRFRTRRLGKNQAKKQLEALVWMIRSCAVLEGATLRLRSKEGSEPQDVPVLAINEVIQAAEVLKEVFGLECAFDMADLGDWLNWGKKVTEDLVGID